MYGFQVDGFSHSIFPFLLQGLEQLRSGILQQQKPFIQASQSFPQLHQMLTPQHQQQLMLAQQNLTSPSVTDDGRRLRMLLNSRMAKDGLPNSVGDVVPNVGSPLQAGSPLLPRGDSTEMIIKVLNYYITDGFIFYYILGCFHLEHVTDFMVQFSKHALFFLDKNGSNASTAAATE